MDGHPNPLLCDPAVHVGPRLGTFHLKEGKWEFRYADGVLLESNFTIDMCEGLLDFEVEVSLLWLSINRS